MQEDISLSQSPKTHIKRSDKKAKKNKNIFIVYGHNEEIRNDMPPEWLKKLIIIQ
jgi:hypothetical protein